MGQITESRTSKNYELLALMQRNHEVIQRLSKKLCSYTYEPKCASHFEKYLKLKNSFKTFEKHQKQINEMAVRRKSGIVHNLDLEIQLHLNRFKQLQAEIAEYLLNMGEKP